MYTDICCICERKNDMSNMKGKAKKKKGALHREGRFFGRLMSVLLTLILIGVITGIIVAGTFAVYCRDYLFDSDYDIPNLQFELDMTTRIYYPEYSDLARTQLVGYRELEDQRIHGLENRFWAPVQNMPENLKNAFIAIEDRRFYQHNGIDIKRTLGATLELLKGNKSYGGSTITQQLIKNVTDERDGTIQRKVTEISRAISLTKKKTKSEVLEMYLNTIPLSHGNYGVAAAANYFFGKDVSELSLIECAALAAIPKSPTKYDPQRNPEYNRERRETVLWEMYDQGLISKEDYDGAVNSELVLNITEAEQSTKDVHSYFTDELRRQVQADLMEQYGYSKEVASTMVLSGGLQIYATVDPYIQNIMEEAYRDENTFRKVDDGIQPESAMVIMAPDTGDVLALVGGRGEKTANMVLNRATSKRPIGSSIKPLSVYAPAYDLGLITSATVIDDTPAEYNTDMDRYWPKNSPAVYDGRTTIAKAIGVSKNTTAVKLVNQLTPQYSYDFLTEKLGVGLVRSDIAESPMALGGLTYGMSVLETAGAYTMLANDGVYSKPRLYTKVLDNKGKVILEKGEKHSIAVDKTTAQIMTKQLCGVVESGTGTGATLRYQIEVAGKTGTTNNTYDLYFVGYTPYYLGATWFGYDQNRTLAKFGPNQALAGWNTVMTRVHERVFEKVNSGEETLKKFDYSGLEEAEFCMDSGKKPSELCALDYRGSRVTTGYFKKGTEPMETCDMHTVVKWDRETGSIASERCPAEDVGEIVLIKVGEERMFEHSLKIGDAQFTVMDLPAGYMYPVGQQTSVYSNLLGGKYYGYIADSEDEIPINSYCVVHAHAPEEEIPDDGENSDTEDADGENGDPDDDTTHTTAPDIFDILDIPEDGENGNDENTDNAADEEGKNHTENTESDITSENTEAADKTADNTGNATAAEVTTTPETETEETEKTEDMEKNENSEQVGSSGGE